MKCERWSCEKKIQKVALHAKNFKFQLLFYCRAVTKTFWPNLTFVNMTFPLSMRNAFYRLFESSVGCTDFEICKIGK